MSSARTVVLLPSAIDPFRRLRSVTSPDPARTQQPALHVGPESITQLAGRPGPAGPVGPAGESAPASQDPALLYLSLIAGYQE